MPTSFKRGLSTLGRAQAALSAKQLRRSAHEHNAQKTAVAEKTRGLFIAQTATPPQAAELPPEASEKPT
jgi:hypothetical protein